MYWNIAAKGGIFCFWCLKQTGSPPLGASNTLRIVKNGLEMRKLWPPKVKGVKFFLKKTIEHYKGRI